MGLAVVFAGLAGCRPLWERAVEDAGMHDEWKRSEVMEEMRVEGEIRARRADLLKVLQARFATVPDDIAAAVSGMTDLARLSRWFKHALKAKSLEAFRAAVRVPTANGPHA
jgi:hypothetical protein